MLTMMSLVADSSTRLAACLAPVTALAFSALGSNTVTWWPAFTRLRAMGPPMWPTPMKPMLGMMRLLRSEPLKRQIEVRLIRQFLKIPVNNCFRNLRSGRRVPLRLIIALDQERPHALEELRPCHHVPADAPVLLEHVGQGLPAHPPHVLERHLEAGGRAAPQQVEAVGRPRIVAVLQRGDDGIDRVEAEADVDRRLQQI